MSSSPNSLYRMLPQIGELLAHPAVAELCGRYSRALVVEQVHILMEQMRNHIRAGECDQEVLTRRIQDLPASLVRECEAWSTPTLRPVINATGVVLQTNLGRAPLSDAALRAIAEVASGYCNLETDLDAGRRSQRDVHAEELILLLFALRSGKHLSEVREEYAAAVVNNCAAATLLVLNTLAEDGEVIVSRGELVEIGGGFRVPDVLRKSGAMLREVGTTNRTRIRDYADAITERTKLILRVHRSNFSIEGFTEQPELSAMAELGASRSIAVFEDQGTGCVLDMSAPDLKHETWIRSLSEGIDVIACSGDKLLGGPQCGIIVGRRELIEQVRANSLYRALRVDKLTYAALSATLRAYITGEEESIPAIRMLRANAEEIRERCVRLATALSGGNVHAEIVPVESVVGGGTSPGTVLPSFAVALQHASLRESEMAAMLRSLPTPLMARTSGGRVLLDLRTVFPQQDAETEQLLQAAFSCGKPDRAAR